MVVRSDQGCARVYPADYHHELHVARLADCLLHLLGSGQNLANTAVAE